MTIHYQPTPSTTFHQYTLGRLDFINYHNFESINDSYSDLIQKVMGFIDLVAPIKSTWVKENWQEWFGSEVSVILKEI